MSDTPGQAARSTDHPNVSDPRRRRFLRGAGVAATGTLVTGRAAAGETDGSHGADGRGADDDHEDDDEADDAGDRRNGDPALIAHRGFAGLYPENTVGAVAAAASGGRSSRAPSRGADLIEIDVVPTADGDVVAFHDDRLASRDGGERGLTDAEGVVWETDTETVTSAAVLGTDETVPLLADVMDAIPSSVGVNVELKNPGSFDVEFAADLEGGDLERQRALWGPFVGDVLAVVDDAANDVLFSSFYEAALAEAREQSGYPVAPLLWDSIDRGLDIARQYDAEAVHPPYNMVKGTPFFKDPYFLSGDGFEDTDLVGVAHEEGRAVNVYTLATFYQAERLADAGVDGIIADHADLLRFGAGGA